MSKFVFKNDACIFWSLEAVTNTFYITFKNVQAGNEGMVSIINPWSVSQQAQDQDQLLAVSGRWLGLDIK